MPLYVGFASGASLGVERSKDVALESSVATTSPAFAGIIWRHKALALSAEVEHAKLNSFAIRASTRL